MHYVHILMKYKECSLDYYYSLIRAVASGGSGGVDTTTNYTITPIYNSSLDEVKLAVAPCGSFEKNCWGWEGVLTISVSLCWPSSGEWLSVDDLCVGCRREWSDLMLSWLRTWVKQCLFFLQERVPDMSLMCNLVEHSSTLQSSSHSPEDRTDWPKYRDTFSTSTVLFRTTTWCYRKLHLIIWRHHGKLPQS